MRSSLHAAGGASDSSSEVRWDGPQGAGRRPASWVATARGRLRAAVQYVCANTSTTACTFGSGSCAARSVRQQQVGLTRRAAPASAVPRRPTSARYPPARCCRAPRLAASHRHRPPPQPACHCRRPPQ
eukprot:5447878-Prymnesium_polylepis.1